jgi:hypothetical protein
METQANWHSELASAIAGLKDRRHSARVPRTLFVACRSLNWSGTAARQNSLPIWRLNAEVPRRVPPESQFFPELFLRWDLRSWIVAWREKTYSRARCRNGSTLGASFGHRSFRNWNQRFKRIVGGRSA